MMAEQTDPNLREFLSSVDSAVAALGPEFGQRIVTPPVLVAAHCLSRSLRLFRAIRVLVDSGFLPEALILARSLLEEVFRLQQLAAANDQLRAQLALGHLHEAAAHCQQLGERAREARFAGAEDPWGREARHVEQQVELQEQALGSRRTKFKAPAAWAAQSGDLTRKRNLFELKLLDFFVHGSAVIRGFSEVNNSDGFTIGEPSDSLPGPKVVLLQAADYTLQSAVAAATFFGLTTTSLDDLVRDLNLIEELLDR